jgi:hypothetical protein
MRSGSLLVATCLAACGAEDRVTFDVTGTPDTVRLEVFIASESPCNDCELQPKDVSTMLQGMRFERDPDPLLTVEAGSDHTAAFAIAPGEHGDKVRSIVVIGYDAQKVISGAALIRDIHTSQQPQLYRVTLTPVTAEPLATTAPLTGSQRVQVWGSEDAHGTCVGLERWHEAELEDRVFIVPADDPDCDGVLEDAECNPYAYLSSTSPATTDTINCVTNSETVGGVQPCQFGAAVCKDGETRGVCASRGLCIPESLCNDTAICPDGQERECMLRKLVASPVSSEIVCHVPFELDTNSNALITCGGVPASTTIEGLGALFSSVVNCDAVGAISESSSGFQFLPEVDVLGADLKVARTSNTKCDVAVTWQGTAQPFTDSIIVGMKISTTGTHDLVLPMKIVRANCAASPTMTCALDLYADDSNPAEQDSIAACAR